MDICLIFAEMSQTVN